MEIILAKTAGFCFGVKRAVDMAFKEETEKTYTFGPIIHNEVVTGELAQKGIHIAEEIEGLDAKKLIIRSHGVSPDVYEKSEAQGIDIVDATCPYVKKIHRIVAKYAKEGYGIIIAGNSAHPEIQGISGWAGQCTILKDASEVSKNTWDLDKEYLLVAQTTYKKAVVDEIIKELTAQNITFEFNNTICSATKERQDEVAEIAKQVDCMLILGSKQSSNTAKLYEISKIYQTNSFCISSEEELTAEMVKDCTKVGITAGASTPHSVIESVIEKLKLM